MDEVDIAVVGAGFSGTATAINLLRAGAAARGLRLALIERGPRLARGLAYGSCDDNLLLNVPAGNMSALADDPDHFLAYCLNVDPNFSSASFLPRRIYGDYLEDSLRAARRGGTALATLRAEVRALRRGAGAGFVVEFEAGGRLGARRVVLALGHFAPRAPHAIGAGATGDARYVGDPWDVGAVDAIARGGAVALLGSGHTAIDTLFRLTSGGATATVYLISRRGLLPQGHRFNPRAPAHVGFPSYLPDDAAATVRGCVRALRAEVARREAAGGDWRDIVNELRAHTPRIWHRWDVAQRRRFLEHVRAVWDVHRHRLAPAACLRLGRLLDSGQVQVLRARLAGCAPRDGRWVLALRERGIDGTRHLPVDALVNCTGPDYDVAGSSAPLVRQMRQDGLLQADCLALGLQVDERYRVLGGDGAAVEGLFYMGPMLRAAHWEAIAVPELRVHAARLAKELLEIPGGSAPARSAPTSTATP